MKANEGKSKKTTLAQKRATPRNSRVAAQMNFTPDDQRRERVMKAISTGRPATIKVVLEELMDAYSTATEQAGKQPEFPLAVVSRQEGEETR